MWQGMWNLPEESEERKKVVPPPFKQPFQTVRGEEKFFEEGNKSTQKGNSCNF